MAIPGANRGGMPGRMPNIEIIALTEADAENFIGAADEMDGLGVDADATFRGGPRGEQAFQTNAAAMSILKKHDFADTRHFLQVGYSLMLAAKTSDADIEKAKADYDQAKKTFAAMRGRVPDATLKMMEDRASQTFKMLLNQPDRNRGIAAKYADQLDAIGE